MINPLNQQAIFPDPTYYWTTYQSEWATDLLFKTPTALDEIYSDLVKHSMLTFNSKDIIRFLGKNPLITKGIAYISYTFAGPA